MLRPSLLLLAAFLYTSPALAAWGENWGEMVWGAAAPSAVPSMDGLGLGLLVLVLIGLAIRGLRSRATLGLIVLASFVGAADLAEAQVMIPNTFTDGGPALASEVNANFQALASAVNASDCATSAEVVCAPALTCPDCGSSFFYDQAVAVGVASVDITSDNADVATAAAAAVDITTDNDTVCTTAGGTWEAGTSTCTPAPAASSYNCWVGGFCSQAAIALPPATYGYTNVYDGHTQGTEPALGAGCNVSYKADVWSDGESLVSILGSRVVGPGCGVVFTYDCFLYTCAGN